MRTGLRFLSSIPLYKTPNREGGEGPLASPPPLPISHINSPGHAATILYTKKHVPTKKQDPTINRPPRTERESARVLNLKERLPRQGRPIICVFLPDAFCGSPPPSREARNNPAERPGSPNKNLHRTISPHHETHHEKRTTHRHSRFNKKPPRTTNGRSVGTQIRTRPRITSSLLHALTPGSSRNERPTLTRTAQEKAKRHAHVAPRPSWLLLDPCGNTLQYERKRRAI